jgi:hypothetical protein
LEQVRIVGQILFCLSWQRPSLSKPFIQATTLIMAKIYSLYRNHLGPAPAQAHPGAPVGRSAPRAIRASVVERLGACGKANCACHRSGKHGSYYYLTQCLAAGQVQKFLLKSTTDQQAAGATTTAFNQFYDGLEELSQINTELLRRGEPLGGSRP